MVQNAWDKHTKKEKKNFFSSNKISATNAKAKDDTQPWRWQRPVDDETDISDKDNKHGNKNR